MSAALARFTLGKGTKVRRSISADHAADTSKRAKAFWKRSVTAVFGKTKVTEHTVNTEADEPGFCTKTMLETLMQMSFVVCSCNVADCQEAVRLLSEEEASRLCSIARKLLGALRSSTAKESDDRVAPEELVSRFIVSWQGGDESDDCLSPTCTSRRASHIQRLRKRMSSDTISVTSALSNDIMLMADKSPYNSDDQEKPSHWSEDNFSGDNVRTWEGRRKMYRKSASDNSLVSMSAMSDISIKRSSFSAVRKGMSTSEAVVGHDPSKEELLMLLRQRADNNTFEKCGELEWTMDGCPRAKDSGSSKRAMVTALIHKHELRSKMKIERADSLGSLSVIPGSPHQAPLGGCLTPQVGSPDSSMCLSSAKQAMKHVSLLAFFIASTRADRDQAAVPVRKSHRNATGDTLHTHTTENTACLLDRARYGMNTWSIDVQASVSTNEAVKAEQTGLAMEMTDACSCMSGDSIIPRLRKQRSCEVPGVLSRKVSREFADSVPEDGAAETLEALVDMAETFDPDEPVSKPLEDTAHNEWHNRRLEKKKKRQENGRTTYGEMLRRTRT